MKFLFKHRSDVCLAYENIWGQGKIMSGVFRERLADRFPVKQSELSECSPSFSCIENFGFKSSSCHFAAPTMQTLFTTPIYPPTL